MTIKAIETEYSGHLFRSRQEARWAVVLNALKIEWLYEFEGFELDDGSWYLPDFWCPKLLAHIEVKSQLDAVSQPALQKARQLANGTHCPVIIVGELDDAIIWIHRDDQPSWPGFWSEMFGKRAAEAALKEARYARF